MTVLLLYVLCYLPFQTFYLVYEFTPGLYNLPYLQTLSEYLYLIVWLPNALNPVCYGCMNEQYKRAFRALIFRPRKFFQTLNLRPSFSHSTVVRTLSKIVEMFSVFRKSAKKKKAKNNNNKKKPEDLDDFSPRYLNLSVLRLNSSTLIRSLMEHPLSYQINVDRLLKLVRVNSSFHFSLCFKPAISIYRFSRLRISV